MCTRHLRCLCLQVITWQQLGFHQKPIGLLNTEGFFDPLLAAFDAFIQEVRVSVCVWGGGGVKNASVCVCVGGGGGGVQGPEGCLTAGSAVLALSF